MPAFTIIGGSEFIRVETIEDIAPTLAGRTPGRYTVETVAKASELLVSGFSRKLWGHAVKGVDGSVWLEPACRTAKCPEGGTTPCSSMSISPDPDDPAPRPQALGAPTGGLRRRSLARAILLLMASPVLAAEPWADRSPHRDGFVVSGGVRLHYLDWGGEGPTLLFLAGLGRSPHIYDDLAPAFRGRFRVLGLTRRGLPKSDRPEGGYDADTLVEDIRALLDRLGIDRAALVGHSFAGVEMTRFAARYPTRVGRLIYLDSAYDYGRDRKSVV